MDTAVVIEPSPAPAFHTNKHLTTKPFGIATASRHRKCTPKKGGGGGKGTWGRPGDEIVSSPSSLDYKDLNWDDDSEKCVCLRDTGVGLTVGDIEDYLGPLVQECFINGLIDDFTETCRALNTDHRAAIPELIMRLAIEHNDAERETASQMISDLFGAKLVSAEDIETAFGELLAELPELRLDTPDAADVLGKFLARAVADDCVPPAFVDRHPLLPGRGTPGARDVPGAGGAAAAATLKKAHTLMHMTHGMARLDSVWGTANAAAKPLPFIIKKMMLILAEYTLSEETQEAARSLHELHCPHFHHEFVRELVLLAIDRPADDTRHQRLLLGLLENLYNMGELSVDQIALGLRRVFASVADLTLDVPHAQDTLEAFCVEAHSRNLISSSLLDMAPLRLGRKRFASEGDSAANSPPATPTSA